MKKIIRVDRRHTAQTCVLLVDLCNRQVIPMCDDDCGKLKLDAYVIVTRVGCCEPEPEPKRVWCGCRYIEPEEPEPMQPAGVQYPAFELDENGRVCFYWDELLFEQPDGRYDVAVFISNEQVTSFQIDLKHNVRIQDVINRAARTPCATC